MNLTICPNQASEMLEPNTTTQDDGLDSNEKQTGTAFLPNKELRPSAPFFIGISHLFNKDGTLVPVVMDFHYDSNIRIEVNYDNFPFKNTNINGYATIDRQVVSDTTGIAADQRYPFMIPSKLYGTYNKRHNTIYTHNSVESVSSNHTAYPDGPPQWGPNVATVGFGSMGLLGSMRPAQPMQANWPGIS